MKTKRYGSILPLVAGIAFGIVALAVPFLLANHYIMVEGKRYSTDNYLFLYWARYYTVTGTNLIQSQMDTYDFGDFPVYAMIVIIIGLILAVISMFAGRGIILNIKGREIKIKLDINPLWLQMAAAVLVIVSHIYMTGATEVLATTLKMDNYVVENGPSMDFLLGSAIALAISTIMTTVKFLKGGSKA